MKRIPLFDRTMVRGPIAVLLVVAILAVTLPLPVAASQYPYGQNPNYANVVAGDEDPWPPDHVAIKAAYPNGFLGFIWNFIGKHIYYKKDLSRRNDAAQRKTYQPPSQPQSGSSSGSAQ